MSQTRRDFLKASGLVIMAGSAGYLGIDEYLRAAGPVAEDKARADRPQPATLVTIFLRGGADMLNALVPFGDDLYYKHRPRIGITAKAQDGKDGVLRLAKNDYWGLNPGMGSLVPMINGGTLIPIVNIGSPDDTRSHFSAQDYMERACPGNKGIARGWLNRYLELTRKPFDAPLRGLSAQTLVPRALRGNYPVLAGNNHTSQMDLFEDLYSSQNLVNMTARDGAGDEHGSRLDDRLPEGAQKKSAQTADQTRDIITLSGANAVERIKALDRAEMTRNSVDYPRGSLGSQLATIARVIKADVGLEVAQADYGSWDHHSDEGGAKGRMTGMLAHLSDCIAAFTKDLGPRMSKVMVLTMSEFGRTIDENGAQGTDHGRGGWMLAAGSMLNGLNGGNFYGKWNGMGDLDQGRFQPVHTDFRSVFAESLNKLFAFDPFHTDIFPGYTGGPQNFVNFMKAVKQG